MRGDGDCFYRAFAFSYVERLLDSSTETAATSLDKLQHLLPLLEQAGESCVKDIGVLLG